MKSLRRRVPAAAIEAIALIAILAFAAVLRFRGIAWGANYYVHPDESFMTQVLAEIRGPGNIGNYFNTATSTLNPYNTRFDTYVYGTFPLFVAKLVAVLTDHNVIGNAHLPGRWISATADCGSVLLTWWIGRQIFSRATGLLAALLLASTMLNIQSAHFFTTDAVSAFLATAAFACAWRAWRKGGFFWFALTGLAIGLATASKPNLLITVGFLALPTLETLRTDGIHALWPRFTRDDDPQSDRHFPVLLATLLGAFVMIWTFRIAQPYAFTGPTLFSFALNPQWQADLDYWRLAQAGGIDMPPSIQWTDRTPILFILDNLVRWGMGPGLGIPVLAGIGVLLVQFARARRWPSWWTLGLTGFVLFHIVFFGTGMAKAQRYLLPAYPLLTLIGAATLMAVLSWGWQRGQLRLAAGPAVTLPRWCHPGVLLPAVAVISTVLYAIAFSSVYTRPITREVASDWIYEHVPAGSSIATEYWDYALPVPMPDHDQLQYQNVELDLYATDSGTKVSKLIGQLNRTDYIVISSNRLFESIPRMPDRYPATIAYYNALFSGALGFDQVASFTSPPQLLGFKLDDRDAEESLTVYEHPEVLIFRKSARWSDDAAWTYLHNALGDGGVRLYPVDTQPIRSMLTPAEQESLDTHATWNSMFGGRWSSGIWPYLTWYLAVQIISLPLMIMLWRMLPTLPDRGYALAKTLGLALVSWLAWWITANGWRIFDRGTILIAWLAFAVLAAVVLHGQVRACWQSQCEHWRWFAWTEGIFLVAFLIGIGLRTSNPVPWPRTVPGEHPWSSFATFTSVLRTPIFPPADSGYSGGVLHDAYLGTVPYAALARITGIDPEDAVRLTLATVFALIALNAWSAATVIARALGKSSHARKAALVAPLLACGLGSLDFARRLGADSWLPTTTGGLGDIGRGLWVAVTGRPQVLADHWLVTGQVKPEIPVRAPLQALIAGDLASASLSVPLAIAILVVTFHIATEIADRRSNSSMCGAFGGVQTAVAPLVLVGVGWGILFGSGFFGGAITLVLAIAVIGVAIAAQCRWELGWSQLRDTALAIVTVIASGTIAIAPFLSRFGVIPREAQPTINTLDLDDWFAIFGVPLVIVAGYLVVQFWQAPRGTDATNPVAVTGTMLAIAIAVIGIATAILIGSLLVFLIVMLALLAVLVWYRQHEIGHLLVITVLAVIWVAAMFGQRLQLTVDSGGASLASAVGDVTWLVLAVVAGGLVSVLISRRHTSFVERGFGQIALTIAAVGILAAGTFPAYAIRERANGWNNAPTINLDGNAVGSGIGDRRAARWMSDTLDGLPIILETPDERGWAGRISALTGFPTVIANVDSEIAQHTGLEPRILQRVDDVNAIYDRAVPFAEVEPLLQKYGVSIIYVGRLENQRYAPLGLQKFREAASEGELAIIYEDGDVTVYRYLPTANLTN